MIGSTLVTSPTTRSFLAPRAAFVGYADHGVDAADATEVYGALYGALAGGWIDAGCLSHHVQIPATDPRIEETWHTLGFGREFVTAVRSTEALSPTDWRGEIRRGRGEDIDTIMDFIDAFHRFEFAAPMSRPYLPETPEERAAQSKMLDNPACACWVATQDGKPLAMQRFQPPPPYLSPMIVPDHSIYLMTGYSEPVARSRGIGTNLLAAGMAWARGSGHSHCLLHFTAANPVSARFWRGRGFRPIEHWLCRRLDDRLASARLHRRHV